MPAADPRRRKAAPKSPRTTTSHRGNSVPTEKSIAKGDFVRAQLARCDGTYHVLLPNGFAKLKAEQVCIPARFPAKAHSLD